MGEEGGAKAVVSVTHRKFDAAMQLHELAKTKRCPLRDPLQLCLGSTCLDEERELC